MHRRGGRGGGERSVRRALQQLGQLGVLRGRPRVILGEAQAVLPPQKIGAHLLVHGGKKAWKADAAVGKVGREILPASLSAPQERGGRVVEGRVGALILLFPAETAQRAAAADLLRRAVKDGGGIFLRLLRRAGDAVIKLAQRGSGLGERSAQRRVGLLALCRIQPPAAKIPARDEQEEKRRGQRLVEQHQSRRRAHRQGEAQNAQKKPQCRADAVAPTRHAHEDRRERIRRRVDKAAVSRRQVHRKADAHRRRDGHRAAALKGAQQHRKQRKDAPGSKAVRRFIRGGGHQHAQQDEERGEGLFLLFRREQRAGAHRPK